MSLTRREFLSVLGISAAVPFVDPLSKLVLPGHTSLESPGLIARLFDPIDSYLADSVHPILDVSDTRYRLPFGWIEKQQAQPIPAAEYRPPMSVTPDPRIRVDEWVRLIAPIARAYETPSTAAFSLPYYWGAAVRVVSILPPANPHDVTWMEFDYRFQGIDTLWGQAHLWSPVDLITPPAKAKRSLIIDRETCTLKAFDDGQLAFSSLVRIRTGMPPGDFRLVTRHIDQYGLEAAPQSSTRSKNLTLYGVTIRNDFGKSHPYASGVSMPIHAARALSQFLPDGAEIHVI